VFPANGLIEVTWVKANTQFAIFFRDGHQGADPRGRLLNWGQDVLPNEVIQCVFQDLPQRDWNSSRWVLYWLYLLIQDNAILACQSSHSWPKDLWVFLL